MTELKALTFILNAPVYVRFEMLNKYKFVWDLN